MKILSYDLETKMSITRNFLNEMREKLGKRKKSFIFIGKDEKSMKYTICYGDILNLDESIDAIVNSANPFMSRGGGVCGLIHKAGGYEFTEFCIKQGGLKVGECKVTPGFDLPYKHVIHVLSPRYDRTEKPKEDLICAYHNVCACAEKNGFNRIAFPLLSGDHHGYPQELALECVKEAFESYYTEGLEVFLVIKTKQYINGEKDEKAGNN